MQHLGEVPTDLDLIGKHPRCELRSSGGRPRAVAVGYDPAKMAPPTVLAVGQGDIAEPIVEQPQANGVPIREGADLAGVLAALEPGTAIPPELCQAVAEVLALVYRLNATRAPTVRGCGRRRPRGPSTAAVGKRGLPLPKPWRGGPALE